MSHKAPNGEAPLPAPARENLVFCHANGFPAPSYRQFFQYLEPQYQLHYIDCLGHDPEYPVTDGWPHLERQLIDYLEQRFSEPVIIMGHSFGAVLAFTVAARRPDLVRGLVCLDPVFIGFIGSMLAWVAKRLGLIDRLSPARRTAGRRSRWLSPEQAYQELSNKALFRDFTPQCLWDYVRAGTRPLDQGVELIFRPEIEANIFRTVPDNIFCAHRRLQVPWAMLNGRQSKVARPAWIKTLERQSQVISVWIDAGHLFPFEQPEAAGCKVLQLLDQLQARQ